MTHKRLTGKQAAFVREYLVDLNQLAAAKRAGYKGPSAPVNACRMMDLPHIQAAIKAAMHDRAERTRVTADRVVTELAKIGFSDMRKLMTWGPSGVSLKPVEELDADSAAAVAEVSETRTKDGGSLKLKLHDKQAALVSLGRHLGIFEDKLRIGPMADKSDAQLNADIIRLAAQAGIAIGTPGAGEPEEAQSAKPVSTVH